MTFGIRDERLIPTDLQGLIGYVQRHREAVWENWRTIVKALIFSGALSEDVAMISGDTVVAHKLGRPPRGYWVLREHEASLGIHTTVLNWRDRNAQTVTLTAGAVGSVDLFFY